MDDSLRILQRNFIGSRKSIPERDQREMFEYDWEMEYQTDEEDEFKLRLLSNEIMMGSFNGHQKINSMILFGVDDEIHGIGMRVSLTNSGCKKCASAEVYHLQLQMLQNKQRLKVEHWVECCCGGEKIDKIEENTYYAVKMNEAKVMDKEKDPSSPMMKKGLYGKIHKGTASEVTFSL